MLFNSVSFLIFFPVVFFVYALIPRKARMYWLLAASYYFYMSWNASYAALIALSTVVTWFCARRAEACETEKAKKRLLAAGLLINFGILFFFKYLGFALSSLNAVLRAAGVPQVTGMPDILLPVGISFYTFQAVGYMIDVFRGETKAEENLLRYALFISFFPQLVAGPIERSGNLLAQIRRIDDIRVWDYGNITGGLMLMLWGMFQKVVIADRISVVVDTVFAAPWAYGSMELLTAMFTFSIQIYCDFCAYSTIAMGAARVLGFRLTDNFDTPYLAEGIGDFWRRWHITLGAWMRDYLFYPLARSRALLSMRKTLKKKYPGSALYKTLPQSICSLAVFLVVGLWHGASWTCVAWGLAHGIYRVAGSLLDRPAARITARMGVKKEAFSYRLLKIAGTFFLVSLALVFFRAPGMRLALYYLTRMFTRWNPWVLFDGGLYALGIDRFEAGVMRVAIGAMVIVDLVRYKTKLNFADYLRTQNLWFRWAVCIGLVTAILVYGAYGILFDSAQFIYFAF